ncbi:glycosyltransferase [Actinomyces timonensis]|uniref:Glycosyltransferase n=1 Tax=Actinomyces timonensis TaxID=1288391 RepID=A0AAU8N3A5_9ACTO
MTAPGPEARSSAESSPGAGAGRAQDETLAVVVTAGVTAFLPQTLVALTAQTAVPAAVLIVDVASRANGLGDGTPVEEAVEASGLDLVTAVRILRAPAAPTLGGAVARGLALAQERAAARPRPETSDQDEGRPLLSLDLDPSDAQWLWLLHDDSAPEPDCLAELLQAVTTARSIALAGPKQVDWDNPHLLLEVGLRATGSARRANDIAPGEIDQGQHDDRSDVLAVGTAGALISHQAWEGVGGASPDMPLLSEGLELLPRPAAGRAQGRRRPERRHPAPARHLPRPARRRGGRRSHRRRGGRRPSGSTGTRPLLPGPPHRPADRLGHDLDPAPAPAARLDDPPRPRAGGLAPAHQGPGPGGRRVGGRSHRRLPARPHPARPAAPGLLRRRPARRARRALPRPRRDPRGQEGQGPPGAPAPRPRRRAQ